MPNVKTQGVQPGEWLISDANGQLSRDSVTVTVGAGVGMKSGTVLAQITASKKYVPHNNAASDGSQLAKAILIYDIPSAPGARDVAAAVYIRSAEVWGSMLNQGAGVPADVVAELAAQNIIVR